VSEPFISAFIIRRSPGFLSTLMRFAQFRPSRQVATAATDGRDVFYNQAALEALPQQRMSEALLHALLHAALGHVARRGDRDPRRWHVAAEISLNGWLAGLDEVALPIDAIRDENFDELTPEQMYDRLEAEPSEQITPEQRYDTLAPQPWRPCARQCFLEEPAAHPELDALYWKYAARSAAELHELRTGSRPLPEPWRRLFELAPAAPATLASTAPGVEAILDGRSTSVEFPERPAERFRFVLGVGTQFTDERQALNGFLWLAENAPPEWFQLCFAGVMRPRLQAAGRLREFFKLVARRRVDFEDFIQRYLRLAGLG
jgi:hypothetical protein